MIVVHHLNHSRSSRVLWLLEEIGVDYRIVHHEREPGFRAPKSLRAIHPLGRAPVVELDGDIVAESAVILAEIHARAGAGRFAPARGTPDYLAHEEWLHFAESSAAGPLMTLLYGRLAGGIDGVLGKIVGHNVRVVLDQLERGLQNRSYLLGEALTLADIQTAYLVELADYLDLLGDRSVLLAYRDRYRSRPGFERAIVVGGPVVPPKAG